MTRKFVVCTWTMVWGGLLAPQRACEGQSILSSLVRHLTIANTLDPKTKQDPASFQATFAPRSRPAYDINLATSLDAYPGANSVGVNFEWHQLSTTDKPQRTLLLGAGLGWELRSGSNVHPLLSGRAQWKHDGVARRNSASASLRASPIVNHPIYSAGRGCVNPAPNSRPPWYYYLVPDIPICAPLGMYVYQVNPGVEYESGKADSTHPAAVWRAAFGGTIAYYPCGRPCLSAPLRLHASYDYRRGSSRESGGTSHPLFQAGVELTIAGDWKDSGRAVSIAFDYVNGDDPSQGLARQRYVRLSLKAGLQSKGKH